MDEIQLSIGYKMLMHKIGEDYANVVLDIASTNARNTVYIPLYVETSSSRLKKSLPENILKKLVKDFGGQRLYVSKKNIKLHDAFLRKKATQDLTKLGYSPCEIAILIGVTEKTVFDSCKEHQNNYSQTNNQVQLGLF